MPITDSTLFDKLKCPAAEQHWREFVQIYRPLIAHAARSQGVPSQDVEDVEQVVLLKLVHLIPSFSYQQKKGFFRSWLRKVTQNASIDLHRNRARRAMSIGAIDLPAEEEQDTDRDFQHELFQVAMRSVQHEFRERTWSCFLQHGLHRNSAAEVSRELGISENAVLVNSSRVMSRLREFCEFHGEELQYDRPAFRN